MTSQGYHGEGQLSSKVIHNGIVGPNVARGINAATQLTSADSGATISILPTAASYIIYLPTVAAGLHFRFVAVGVAAGDVTIRGDSTSIIGTINQPTPTDIAAVTNLIIEGGVATVGVIIDMHGINSNTWCATVSTSVDASVTTS